MPNAPGSTSQTSTTWIALPCAFTNFVTCPIAPRENVLDILVPVGERRPVETVERVLTYAEPRGVTVRSA